MKSDFFDGITKKDFEVFKEVEKTTNEQKRTPQPYDKCYSLLVFIMKLLLVSFCFSLREWRILPAISTSKIVIFCWLLKV